MYYSRAFGPLMLVNKLHCSVFIGVHVPYQMSEHSNYKAFAVIFESNCIMLEILIPLLSL